MLSLRQIEVIRAITISGTISGAARLLNVSAPGISRILKYTEGRLGFALFSRDKGRYLPTKQAATIFTQINSIHDRISDLEKLFAQVESGTGAELKAADASSLTHTIVPRVVAQVRHKYPDLMIDFSSIRLEEAIDYLILGKGEAAITSHRLEHPMLNFERLGAARLVCVVASDHKLAGKARVTPNEMAEFPMIGIPPEAHYGPLLIELFESHSVHYKVTIKTHSGVVSTGLAAQGLGIAIVDEFVAKASSWKGLKALDIDPPLYYQTFVGYRTDAPQSSYCDYFISSLRDATKEYR